ncbi:hypothetical protein [Paenibacillus sp. NPDC093718]|uniref:hypothetical protein n=1 Tax=Paenibacillus sp. NPDC093718 TaxID=3390601 RepID=UPI003D03D4AC
MYIAQLPVKDQKEIAFKLRNKLIAEGYSENEITQAVKDGMNSKVSDVTYLID